MYAIIQTGGKQFRVSVGDVIDVEKLAVQPDESVDFEVLMVADDAGELQVGSPVLEGVVATGKVVAHGKAKKVIVFKYKAKKDYRRKRGHRQPYTRVEITAIG